METSLSAYCNKLERKQALVKVNNLSASGNGVPRKRGVDAASLSGAPQLDSNDRKERWKMRFGLNAVTAITAVTLSAAVGMCYCAFADQPVRHERVIFASVSDVMVQTLDADLKAEIDEETQRELMLEVTVEHDGGLPDIEAEVVDVAEYEPPAAPVEMQGNPDGLNTQVGVIEHGGHVETYYATSAAYDDQLTVDEQGFYRDAEGRYVVASSDHEIGEIIETSQGEAVVMDDGTAPGVVDMHVNWR